MSKHPETERAQHREGADNLGDGDWGFDWHEFIKLIQASGLIARNPDTEAAFKRRFHNELAFICLNLNILGVAGGELTAHPGPPEKCDVCASPITNFGFFVDGATTSGEWANMCPRCYAEHGSGIGYGTGQLYRKRSASGPWFCIAGGDPQPASEKRAEDLDSPEHTNEIGGLTDDEQKFFDDVFDDLIKASGETNTGGPLAQRRGRQRPHTGPEPDWVKGLRSLFPEGEPAERKSKSD